MIFQWREDEEHGGDGWIAKGYPNFNITAPGGFGHDCIEHLPRGFKHGAAADELMALGARWRVRVDSGWWNGRGYGYLAPENTWGSELDTILRNLGDECVTAPKCKVPNSFYVGDILAEGVRVINRERERDDEPVVLTEDSDIIVNMGKWLQIGYEANEQRFRGVDGYDVMLLSERLDDLAKKHKYGEEGDLLHVRVHERDMDCSIRQIRANYFE